MHLLPGAIAVALSLVGLAAQAQDTPAFEAASVKPNRTGSREVTVLFRPGTFTAVNETLRELIRWAHQIQSFRIIGAPDWTANERFDVVGTTQGEKSREEMSAMLRGLLVERFKLAAHMEVRELPIYALVVQGSEGKTGSQLRPASAAACSRPTPGVQPAPQSSQMHRCGALLSNPGIVRGREVTLAQLTSHLSQELDRMVFDRTGLSGPFDLDLAWTRDPAIDGNRPGLFTALQEQLGLRLEAGRGPVEVLVIDSVEHPTPD